MIWGCNLITFVCIKTFSPFVEFSNITESSLRKAEIAFIRFTVIFSLLNKIIDQSIFIMQISE